MARVVSVSLGTSKRDKIHDCEILGTQFRIERRGTDGDKAKFKSLVEELDGHVDAIGVGGADIWLVTEKKKYPVKEVLELIKGVKTTPVVDGSGLKHTLERATIETLQSDGTVDFSQERVLLVSAVDRFGMAQALDKVCPNVTYGDFLFGLGLPIPIRKYSTVSRLADFLLPIVTCCPLSWFYPMGEKQEERKPKCKKEFDWATMIAGDWHYIRRYAPDQMPGKTILTQTLRSADLEWLKVTGARQAITTTPVMAGETFATNVMEGVLLTLIGKPQADVMEQDYLEMLAQLSWKPNVIPL
ncbi:MAG: quinate 5-dehydrogenase [Chthonomonadaceae bacterium]|nr:quinate 5-dehydrogenase [Chthonomonadaceae bacterium]